MEMMPCTQSTFSCCTSLLKRSIVSFGEDLVLDHQLDLAAADAALRR